jgi:AcrR family transcriptional regulator
MAKRQQAVLPSTDAAERIREAATALFRAHGYFGTPMRALASSVDVEAASLYYHFPSKQEILFDGFARTMDDLLTGLNAAVAGETRPEARLRAAVRFHVLFHTERQSEAFVSHAEMRALAPANRTRIVARRRAYEDVFYVLLDDGVQNRVFHVADTRLTAIAILTLCSGVADWFKPDGRLDAATVVERYVELVDAMVGCCRKRAARTPRQAR